MTVSRAFAGDEDLARMQRLVAECWRVRGPLSGTHVGDLPWRMYQHLDKLDEVRVRVWLEDDECVGWAWLWTKDSELDFELHPQRADVADDVLAWADAEAAWALDANQEAVAAIERAGYVRREGDRWYEHHVCELDGEIEEPRLPRGYSVRTFRDGDLPRRVDVHRAAFAPSRVVPESYARLQRAWPYRPDLDHVVTAPGGDFAAFCLCWLDNLNAAGLLEPVGTHPDHRRLGLASAVCLAGLRSLREAGASHAVVLSAGGSSATALYEKVGMPAVARHVVFGREEKRGSERLHP